MNFVSPKDHLKKKRNAAFYQFYFYEKNPHTHTLHGLLHRHLNSWNNNCNMHRLHSNQGFGLIAISSNSPENALRNVWITSSHFPPGSSARMATVPCPGFCVTKRCPERLRPRRSISCWGGPWLAPVSPGSHIRPVTTGYCQRSAVKRGTDEITQ